MVTKSKLRMAIAAEKGVDFKKLKEKKKYKEAVKRKAVEGGGVSLVEEDEVDVVDEVDEDEEDSDEQDEAEGSGFGVSTIARAIIWNRRGEC